MNEEARKAHDELIRRVREAGLLGSCSALLGWDEQTYMPSGGAEHRADQMALLAGLRHERFTDPRIGDLLGILENAHDVIDADSPEAANIRELRRDYDRATRLPDTLVKALARTTSLAQQEWMVARREGDFGRFRPWLEKVISLKREEGQALQAGLPAATEQEAGGDPVYDALLDEYEPGARSGRLARIFRSLREQLVPLMQAIAEASIRRRKEKGAPQAILQRQYPSRRQKYFAEMVAAVIGFDFQRGRLDVTAHPFCTGIGPGDARITTRYNENQFSEAFFGVLHETGHALYEQGLPASGFGTPLGEAASLGIHESQSRLWENAVSRSAAFWRYWYPLAQGVFRESLHDTSLDDFLAAINHVEPGLIRTDADEVTYNLHVIVRFELEGALLRGDLTVADLPSAWTQGYHDLLGVVPNDDVNGCLQDIHWSAGLIGYFPTYTLGNIYAAQLYEAARADLVDLDASFVRGDFAGLLGWLRQRVHAHGRRFRPEQLIESATGRLPAEGPLIASLRSKYGEIYQL